MDDNKLEAKLLKIKALAERGEGGEKEAAIKMYHKLLKKYDIRNCYIGENQYLKLLFQDIISELQLKKPQYEDIILHDFCL